MHSLLIVLNPTFLTFFHRCSSESLSRINSFLLLFQIASSLHKVLQVTDDFDVKDKPNRAWLKTAAELAAEAELAAKAEVERKAVAEQAAKEVFT
jgi:hypothetical protein